MRSALPGTQQGHLEMESGNPAVTFTLQEANTTYMGKKIRHKLEKEEARYAAQMFTLSLKSAPKKTNKRRAPISLPAVCNRYARQRDDDAFKCTSCSPARRAAQLIRYRYCAYAVPAWLIDWLVSEGAMELAAADHERSVALLMSIIYEMGNGRSPRHILKPFLSKTETGLFFKHGRPKDLQVTVFSHFVYCKALAIGLAELVCLRIARLASEVRLDRQEIFRFIQSFIEFCSARKVDIVSVQEIWDYLHGNRLIGDFSFKGRTLASMLALVNAWHEALNKEARAIASNVPRNDWRAMQASTESLKITYRAAFGIPQIWNAADPKTKAHVEVRQLIHCMELVNEGRAMHNCVASYHTRCAQNICSIFSLRIAGERKATIEICNRRIVQVRGNCNMPLAGASLTWLHKWAAKFKIEEAF